MNDIPAGGGGAAEASGDALYALESRMSSAQSADMFVLGMLRIRNEFCVI